MADSTCIVRKFEAVSASLASPTAAASGTRLETGGIDQQVYGV